MVSFALVSALGEALKVNEDVHFSAVHKMRFCALSCDLVHTFIAEHHQEPRRNSASCKTIPEGHTDVIHCGLKYFSAHSQDPQPLSATIQCFEAETLCVGDYEKYNYQKMHLFNIFLILSVCNNQIICQLPCEINVSAKTLWKLNCLCLIVQIMLILPGSLTIKIYIYLEQLE